MSFSLSILLYIYWAFVVFWIFFLAVAVYHMYKYSFRNAATFITTIIFVAVALALLMVSFQLVSAIDWDAQINMFGSPKVTPINF